MILCAKIARILPSRCKIYDIRHFKPGSLNLTCHLQLGKISHLRRQQCNIYCEDNKNQKLPHQARHTVPLHFNFNAKIQPPRPCLNTAQNLSLLLLLLLFCLHPFQSSTPTPTRHRSPYADHCTAPRFFTRCQYQHETPLPHSARSLQLCKLLSHSLPQTRSRFFMRHPPRNAPITVAHARRTPHLGPSQCRTRLHKFYTHSQHTAALPRPGVSVLFAKYRRRHFAALAAGLWGADPPRHRDCRGHRMGKQPRESCRKFWL